MRILIFILFVFLPTTMFAQKFVNVGIEDGLSSHQAYDVVQDKNGFTWVSTRIGYDRFDGEEVVHYKYPDPASPALSPTHRMSFRTNPEGSLWSFDVRGMVYSFVESQNKFQHVFSLQDSLQENIRLLDMFIDEHIWLCTDRGLLSYSSSNNRFKEINAFKDQIVYFFSPTSKCNYIVICSGGIVEYNNCTGSTQNIHSWNEKELKYNITSSLWNPSTNELWLGSKHGDVLIYNLPTKQLINLSNRISELPRVPINGIVQSADNAIYLGSDGGGIFKIDDITKRLLANYREDEDVPHTLIGNGIQDLYLSNAGDLYFASFTGGLNILIDEEDGFEIISHEVNNQNSLRNNVVNNILEDIDGDMWYATNNGVSCHLIKSGKWIHFLDGLSNVGNVFLSLHQFNDKQIMAGSYGKGLFIIDKRKGVIKQIFPGKDNLNQASRSDCIVNILKDSKGRIWMGETFSDLVIYTPDSASYDYLPIVGVNSIEEKDEETVFVGSPSGVWEVDINTLEYKKLPLVKRGTQNIFVNSLNYNQKNQTLWIATTGRGLVKWNVNTKEMEVLNESNGFPSNHIYAVLFHGDDIIWASSENGLIRYYVSNGTIENFSIKDGLSDKAFYKNSKYKSSSGKFYFGSYKGVTYFDPEKIESKEEKAQIYLEELFINNKRVYAHEKESPLNEALNQVKDLTLKHSQHSFSIGFTAITSVNSGKIKYSWKLEGQDEDWTIPSYNKRANYTNVPEGDFKFQLRAISSRSAQIIDERLINIKVKPAIWNTLFAKFLMALLMIFIIAMILRHIRVSNSKKLSDEKIQFFINTAHDVKTPLTLASAPLGDLQKSRNLNEHDQYLVNLSKSHVERLSKAVNQLLDFQKSDMGKSQLVLTKVDIIQLLEDRYAYFNQLAELKNITLEYTPKLKVLEEWIDLSKIEKVLNNLLSNALKYTNEGGKVSINLNVRKSSWEIAVEDDGIGIPKKAQNELFKRYYRGENAINSKIAGTGIGLLLVKKYVQLHKGKLTFESVENKGSKFIVSFKRGRKHYGPEASFINSSIRSEITNGIQVKSQPKPVRHKDTRNKVNLLVVEDNDKLREYLDNALSTEYCVYTAPNGKIALEIARKYNPEIIVSDIGMPELDGIELTNLLKNEFETSHIPIILLTAYNEKKDIIKGLKSGADDYISKPFDTSILLARIENIILNRQKIKERFISSSYDSRSDGHLVSQRDQEFIERAIALVEKHISEDTLSKDFFAKKMLVSPSLLYKKLKALTGQSPSEFVKVIKLKKALSLLKEGEHSIQEVANLTGFSDAKYFSTSFKKFYGKPPSTFIKRNQAPMSK
ncbi:MAG: ATP-binding protein [Bacteroidota bacterium]